MIVTTAQKPNETIDQKLLEVERKIRLVKQTPVESSIRVLVADKQEEIAILNAEIESIRQRDDYLGKEGLEEGSKLDH